MANTPPAASKDKKTSPVVSGVRDNSGFLGRAARAMRGRGAQIDDAVDQAIGPSQDEQDDMHDRQHSDSNNNY